MEIRGYRREKEGRREEGEGGEGRGGEGMRGEDRHTCRKGRTAKNVSHV